MISKSKNILIVEDEDIIRSSLRKLLERHHYTISEAVSVKAARESFNLNSFDLIISDLRLPGGPGTDLINPASCVPVIIMTSYASLRSAVETMRQGAVDYISKPFDYDEILNSVKRVINESSQEIDQAIEDNKFLIGSSPHILTILRTIHRAAPSSAAVLIQGAGGTGKRVIAQAIHNASANAERVFLTINCASTTAGQLTEYLDQLKMEEVGTLFLANVCELDANLQQLALSAIHHKNHYRLIASSSPDLQALSQTGLFRKDLFYRLNVVNIQVPTLRERAMDIANLSSYFLEQYEKELGYQVTLSAQAIEAMSAYHWPGNVRELQNMLYRGSLLSEPGEPISHKVLGLEQPPDEPEDITPGGDAQIDTVINAPVGCSLSDYFTSFVLENQVNMSETALAKQLGISRKSLWERRNKLGISRKNAK
jgi:two-component system response regulator HydG